MSGYICPECGGPSPAWMHACSLCYSERGMLPETDVKRSALELLRRLEPYLDSIICYASTTNEYEGNQLAADVRQFLKDNP